ncbi:MAG: HD domain-containing protein [Chloroflexota bacterium]|nr:HD domain-containing protein [Chloroflexota bacterium]
MPYRLSQLCWSLSARLSESDREWVDQTLHPGERPFFYRMPRRDQVHSVRVARVVRERGGSKQLVRAALLHDCGKTIPPHGVPLLYRGGVVLLGAVSTTLLHRLARPWGPLWPVYLSVHHPALGARELTDARVESAVVELVRRHQDATTDIDLRTLQAADGRH